MVLGGEPRSKYRRSHCMDKRYVFAVDALDVEVEFSGSGTAGDAACVVAVRLRGKSEIPRRSASPAGKQEEEDELDSIDPRWQGLMALKLAIAEDNKSQGNES